MGDRSLTKRKLAAGRYIEDQLAQRTASFWLAALELIERIQAVLGCFDGLADFPVGVTALDV